MISAREVMPPRARGGRNTGKGIRALLLLLIAGGLLCAGQTAAFIKVTPKMLARSIAQNKLDDETRTEIRRFEEKGGAEGAQGLWEIIEKGKQSPSVSYEAFRALGQFGRREDAVRIDAWVAEHYSGRGMADRSRLPSAIFEALGTIGGQEACAFLVAWPESIPQSHDPRSVDVDAWAAGVQKAGCLSDEVLRAVLWGFGRDRWAARVLQRQALEFLAGMGEAEAAARLASYENLLDESVRKDYSLDGARAALLDTSVPWWVIESIMSRFPYARFAKEELLDIYFDLVAEIYENEPDLRKGQYAVERKWGQIILWNSNSTWTRTNVDAYVEGKRQTFQASLSPQAFARMDKLIDKLLRYLREMEGNRARHQAAAEARTAGTGAETGASGATAVPPPAGAKIQTVSFPEPRFFSVESRLQRTELFVFDPEMKWLGLGRVGLALASFAAALEDTSDDARREALHARALRTVALEENLPKESGWRGDPLLVPLVNGSETEVAGAEWSPRSRDFGLAVRAGEEKLLLFRVRENTRVGFHIVGLAADDSADPKGGYWFGPQTVAAGSWVIAAVGAGYDPPVVFLSLNRESLGQRYRLQPAATVEEEPLQGDEQEKATQRWFATARQTVLDFEEDVFARAGGISGVASFRKELRDEIDTLQQGRDAPPADSP